MLVEAAVAKRMFIFGRIVVFLLGLATGSFLNVLIDRLPKEEPVLMGRSYCDHCHHKLSWYDLIPLLSFVLLRGRCRYCQKRISWQYPLVELVTGVLFVLGSFGNLGRFGESLISLCYLFFVICSLIVIFFTDLKYGIIPDKVVFPAIGLVVLFHLMRVFCFVPPSEESRSLSCHLGGGTSPGHLGGVLLAGLAVAAFFGLLVILTKGRGMGMGDVKLALLMGLFLGFPKILIALYFAFLTGALVSVILILGKKKKFGQTIPFGPFLVGGTIFALFYGSRAIDWWLALFK